MKLYNVPRNSKIRLGVDIFLFQKIDGMYSICIDIKGNVNYISANTDVEIVEGDF